MEIQQSRSDNSNVVSGCECGDAWCCNGRNECGSGGGRSPWRECTVVLVGGCKVSQYGGYFS